MGGELEEAHRDEGLSFRKRRGRKRAVGTRAPMEIPQGPHRRWSLDFMSDALQDGRRFRVLTVIGDVSRECLAAVADTSIGGARVARELDRIAELRGYPCLVVSDNGTEPTSHAMLKWQQDRNRLALHPATKANAKWSGGELRWAHPRGTLTCRQERTKPEQSKQKARAPTGAGYWGQLVLTQIAFKDARGCSAGASSGSAE